MSVLPLAISMLGLQILIFQKYPCVVCVKVERNATPVFFHGSFTHIQCENSTDLRRFLELVSRVRFFLKSFFLVALNFNDYFAQDIDVQTCRIFPVERRTKTSLSLKRFFSIGNLESAAKHCRGIGWGQFHGFFPRLQKPSRSSTPEADTEILSHEKKNDFYFPLYWLVHRDPYNGLLQSLYNWVV